MVAGAVLAVGAHGAAPALAAPATDPRDLAAYAAWRASGDNARAADAFEARLASSGVADVIATPLLLRNARDWARCGAAPFSVPPPDLVPRLVRTLKLVMLLRQRNALPQGEAVSVYRDAALNRCADGATRSAHMQAAAIDFLSSPRDAAIVGALCKFWREHGAAWDMGLSIYKASGNIHIDTAGHRSWGGACAAP